MRLNANALCRLYLILDWAAALVAAGLVVWLGIVSVDRWGPAWQHDYPSYHLPFIVRDFNMSTWQLWPNLLPIWEGYPPLAHYIQGALFWLTGQPAVANAINSVAIILFIPTLRYLEPKLRLGWLMLGLFALPLFLLAYPTGGLDIWFSLCVLLQFVALTAILKGDDRKSVHVIFIAAVAVAINSKMNSWAASLFLSSIYALHQLYRLRRNPEDVLVHLFVLSIAIGFWPLRNWIVMGSPVWPFCTFFTKVGDDPALVFSPAVRPEVFAHATHSVMYFLSFFELTRLMTPEHMRWSFTMWQGGSQSMHQLMGGLDGKYMGLLAGFLAYLIYKRTLPKEDLLLTLGAVVIAAIVPQSHEMRYSLFVPMMMILIALKYAAGFDRAIGYAIISFALIVLVSSNDVKAVNIWNTHNQLLSSHPEIRQFWRERKPVPLSSESETTICIPGTDSYWGLADPLGIYFSGPTLNEFNVRACRAECTLPWQGCGVR